jgi:hypothetical protein
MITMAIKTITAAAGAAFVVGAAGSAAHAAPAVTGTGALIRDAAPAAVTTVQWGVHGYRPRFHRPYRPYRFYRPYRPAYFGGPIYGGPRCFWRPAREVFTPYGVRIVPARRVCRY